MAPDTRVSGGRYDVAGYPDAFGQQAGLHAENPRATTSAHRINRTVGCGQCCIIHSDCFELLLIREHYLAGTVCG